MGSFVSTSLWENHKIAIPQVLKIQYYKFDSNLSKFCMLLFLASFVCCYFWHVLHVALYLNMQNSLDVGSPKHSIQLVIKNIQITYCFQLKGNTKCRILGSSYKKQTKLLNFSQWS